MKAHLIVLLMLSALGAQAKCVKDVYSLGLGSQSLVYAKQDLKTDKEQVRFVSEESASLSLSQMIYCPQSNWEFIPRLELQRVKFGDTPEIELRDDARQWLVSLGVEMRRQWTKRWEWLLEFTAREDLIFEYSKTSERVVPQSYFNLIFSPGLRYLVWDKIHHQIFSFIKIGLMIPIGADLPGPGARGQLGADYWFKASQKNSYVFSFGVDVSVQEYGADRENVEAVDYQRRQVFLLGSYVFRF